MKKNDFKHLYELGRDELHKMTIHNLGLPREKEIVYDYDKENNKKKS